MKATAASLLMERFISEGGAYGHLMHLYDNRDLTFAEIKEILNAASEGHLEKVTEKTDGMNLVFSWDVSEASLKVARSSGDIKSGGMDAKQLAAKFSDRGNITEAFNTAFQVLSAVLLSLSKKTQLKVFGPRANNWYSIEVIYPANPNVINYDKNYLVFHAHGMFQVDRAGKIVQKAEAPGIDLLANNIDSMQNAITQRSWRVLAPGLVSLKKLSDGTILSSAIAKIDEAMSAAGVSDADTIDAYLHSLMEEEVADLGKNSSVSAAIVSRCLEDPDAPSLVAIKKMLPKEEQKDVSSFVAASPALLKRLIEPIEHAIHRFSIELLRGMQSTMVASHDAEVERLRSEVGRAIAAIEASGNVAAMDILKKQMEKLERLENIASSSEGIVFRYKGNVYKFTGAFAPANQILGLFKYGRGNVKISSESRDRLGVLLEMAGMSAERQERGVINAINSIASKDNPVDVKSQGSTIKYVIDARKAEGFNELRKEMYADVILALQNGSEIKVSAKGPTAPSLAGGGLEALSMLIPDVIERFLNAALKHMLQVGLKHGQLNAPNVFGKLSMKDALNVLRGNEAMGGPIDYMYVGPMDVEARFNEKKSVTLNGALIPIEEYAKKSNFYLRVRKRRHDQPFDAKTRDKLGLPVLFGRSVSKGDNTSRIVITNKLPNEGMLVKF